MKSKLANYNCGVSLWKEDGTFAETTIGYNIKIPENMTTEDILTLFKMQVKRIDKNEED